MKPETIKVMFGKTEVRIPAAIVATAAMATVLAGMGLQPAANGPVGPIPALGQYWPGQGGVNAGLIRNHDGGRDFYLIVSAGDDLGDLAWGPRDFEVQGASSAWDGLANTKAMIASSKKHPAAEACAAFTCEGHNDFYLPARRELQVAEANVPEMFAKVWHYSSSQRSAYGAYILDFSVGNQTYGNKPTERRVRPVRRVLI